MSGEYTKGIIDEVAIFNKTLTEADIKDAMNNGLAKILLGQAVTLSGKLSSTWGNIKGEYNK